MKFILECYEFLEKEEIYCLEKIRKHTTGLLVRGNFPITEISMRYFSENLKNLTYLNLEINKIGNEGARYIAKYLANLTSLNLKYNNISDEGAHYLSEKLSKLISLDLGLNKIGDEGARYIAQNLPNLTYLNLDCNEIGDEGARYIAQNLPKLTSLNLNRNKIGDAGVRYIAQNLTELTSLDLWSNKIGDESARHIAQNLTKLTSLNLWSNKIGDEGARHIAQNLTKLTSLNLESNEIGDEGARYIAENLRGLTSLALSINNPVGIPNETLRNIKALRAYFQAQGVEKKVLNTQVRAMLIGEPEAGKTTLLKALMKTPFVLGAEKRTHGLERGQIELKQINHHDFEMQDLQLDIWDMGGQSLQLMMHGFFFHSDAIFLLLINEQSSFSALKLWLNQLKYQRHGDGNAKIIVIPVLNPTKNTTKKISGTLIERLKTEFAHNFDWMRPIVVDLADEIHPNVGDLTNALRVILASFPLKEYWESIDDIASDLGNWPEDYLRSSRFIDKLRDRSVFKKSFSRISGKVREENPNEVFDEREFASLIRGILELKGIITALENPDFVILNPAWIEKGLYSLSPPEDKIVPKETNAAVFLRKLCGTDGGMHLPGIFTLPDIQPFWDDLGFNESNQEDLLSILCKEKLGLVIKLDGGSGADRYFVPVYLDHVQDKTSENLLEAISEAYQKALFCIIYDNIYWPPYFIYRHMVLCGADAAYKNEQRLSFELFDHKTTLSKQHYWIRSRNNPNLIIEIIFYQDRFWCFAHASNGQDIDILQGELKRLKQDLYRILQRSSSVQSLDIKSLVPCPTCVSNHLTNTGRKDVDGINFYNRETLVKNGLSRKLLSCHIDHPSAHYAEASQVLNHLKSTNYDQQVLTLANAVTVISVFVYYCGLAVKEPSPKPNTLSLTGRDKNFSIQSIDRNTLNRLWQGETIERPKVEQLGAALIQRFGYLSLLTDSPEPGEDDYNGKGLHAVSVTYLKAISQRISEDTQECIEKLTEAQIDGQPVDIQFEGKRNSRLPVNRLEFKWLRDHLNSKV